MEELTGASRRMASHGFFSSCGSARFSARFMLIVQHLDRFIVKVHREHESDSQISSIAASSSPPRRTTRFTAPRAGVGRSHPVGGVHVCRTRRVQKGESDGSARPSKTLMMTSYQASACSTPKGHQFDSSLVSR